MDCCTGTCRTSCGCSAGGCGRPSPQARRFSFAAQRTRCPRSAACRMPHRCIRWIVASLHTLHALDRCIATYVARTVAANKKPDGAPHVVACCTVRVHVLRVAWSCVARCALHVARYIIAGGAGAARRDLRERRWRRRYSIRSRSRRCAHRRVGLGLHACP